MIALDTNVLVRYLVEDDARQTEAAARLIERTVDRGEALVVTDVVLCEVVWVLASCYEVPRREIVAVLHDLLRASHLVIPSSDGVSRAISAYRGGRGDFADYLILERAREAGATRVATFDRALLREEGFVVPG